MGCTNSAEKESSDKFSNSSAREQGAIAEGSSMHRSQLMDEDWFKRMSQDPTGLFDELAKGEGKDKHIDKATALKVANSALVISLENMLKKWAGRYNDLKQDVSSKATEAIKDKVRLHNTDAVDSIFDAIDTNHNGKIEKKEWSHLIRFATNGRAGMKEDLSAEKKEKKLKEASIEGAELISGIFDRNGDGQVDVNEMTEITHGLLENLMTVVHVFITAAGETGQTMFIDQVMKKYHDLSWEEMIQPELTKMVEHANDNGMSELVEYPDGLKGMLQEAATKFGAHVGINASQTLQDHMTHAFTEFQGAQPGPHMGFVSANIMVNILDHFATTLKDVKDDSKINQDDFINRVCKPTADKAMKEMDTLITELQKSGQEFVESKIAEIEAGLDDQPRQEFTYVADYMRRFARVDFRNIFAVFWRTFSQQSQQIYEALFKVLKCGKNTNDIEKEALEAIFCVVLGEDKVPMKDRPKVLFDAFDHNGDGTFSKAELVPFVCEILKLGEKFAHAYATANASFFTNHSFPAGVKVGFNIVGGNNKLKLEHAWMAFPGSTTSPLKEAIQHKFGKDPDTIKEYVKDMKAKMSQGLPDGRRGATEQTYYVVFGTKILEEVAKTCQAAL